MAAHGSISSAAAGQVKRGSRSSSRTNEKKEKVTLARSLVYS